MESVLGKLLYIFNRFKEPSTHAALAGMLGMLGVNIPDQQWSVAINGLAVLFGVLGVFVSESAPKTKIDGF